MDDNTNGQTTPEGADELTPGAGAEHPGKTARSEKAGRRRGGKRATAPHAEAPAEATAPDTTVALEAAPAEGEVALAEGALQDGASAASTAEAPRQPLKLDPSAWEVLEERARALARTHSEAEQVLGEEVVVFRLGDGSYSLPARYIREVQPLDSYTPLPSTPAFVVGLVNLRGRLLAALDIRPLLELKHQAPQPGAHLIVVAIGPVEVSLLADAVEEVRHSDTDLAPALSTTAGRGLSWVRGIDRDLNLVLDPHGLLSDPRLIVNSQA